jgi:hypothetical protein
MPEHAGREDHLHGLFKDFADAIADSGFPPGLVSPELLQHLLQTNRALLQRYQGVLAQHSGDDSIAQQHQELVKAAMLCWLDMGKAFRTYRDSVISAQSALVSRYLELMDRATQDSEAPKT